MIVIWELGAPEAVRVPANNRSVSPFQREQHPSQLLASFQLRFQLLGAFVLHEAFVTDNHLQFCLQHLLHASLQVGQLSACRREGGKGKEETPVIFRFAFRFPVTHIKKLRSLHFICATAQLPMSISEMGGGVVQHYQSELDFLPLLSNLSEISRGGEP